MLGIVGAGVVTRVYVLHPIVLCDPGCKEEAATAHTYQSLGICSIHFYRNIAKHVDVISIQYEPSNLFRACFILGCIMWCY